MTDDQPTWYVVQNPTRVSDLVCGLVGHCWLDRGLTNAHENSPTARGRICRRCDRVETTDADYLDRIIVCTMSDEEQPTGWDLVEAVRRRDTVYEASEDGILSPNDDANHSDYLTAWLILQLASEVEELRKQAATSETDDGRSVGDD